MALLKLWDSNPDAISSFSIEQVIASAGDGKLKDNSVCSQELRTYLSQISSLKLFEYIHQCLISSFPKSGMALQDIVNELGRRLDYEVRNGNYQGTSGSIGFDGIWVSPEGHTLVIEVKTTDAYRISLDNLARYRDELRKAQDIRGTCSILIIVGREDTGELEAQVRGSRHAWDIRLISTDALSKLAEVKESTDEADTGRRIREILVPIEYTKLDTLIEAIFVAAKDAARSVTAETEPSERSSPVKGPRGKSVWEFTDSAVLQFKRDRIVTAVGKALGAKLIKRSRAMYWDADHQIRIACTVSKRYERGDSQRYWYAYHQKWDDFLSHGRMGQFILGAMDLGLAFMVPHEEVKKHLKELNTTTRDDGTMYWHIVIAERTKSKYELVLAKAGRYLDLSPFVIDC